MLDTSGFSSELSIGEVRLPVWADLEMVEKGEIYNEDLTNLKHYD